MLLEICILSYDDNVDKFAGAVKHKQCISEQFNTLTKALLTGTQHRSLKELYLN